MLVFRGHDAMIVSVQESLPLDGVRRSQSLHDVTVLFLRCLCRRRS